MTEHGGSTPLFAVFALSILVLVMLIATLWKMCGGSGEEEAVVKPWMSADKSAPSLGERARKYLTISNISLVVGWAAVIFLFWYVGETAKQMKPFDPFEILQLSPGASERDVKKAYRKLSLVYHPDKNPDPLAHEYFAEHITKAYQALTDDVSRANYEKYGHPDGPQHMSLGVALPEWVFSKDSGSAPWLLAALVCGGILLPLGAAAYVLLRAEKFGGVNQVNQLTLGMFLHSKYNVKESQGLSRIPETLVIAMEFINLPTPADQGGAMEELRKAVLRLHPDVREKAAFWKRRPGVIKTHMLLLAYLAREDIPPVLRKDLQFVLKRAPVLVEEMIKIAMVPRPPAGVGWLTPTLACVEFLQCMVQAVPLAVRKPILSAGSKGVQDGTSPLLQLPHFNSDLLRKLTRKKVRSYTELVELKQAARCALLMSLGLSEREVEEVETALTALPSLTISSIKFNVDGAEEEDEMMEGDIVTCSVRVMVSRASHSQGLGKEGLRGRATLAYAQLYPHPKEEQWWFFLGDPVNNSVLSLNILPFKLMEAEAIGATKASQLARHGYEGGLPLPNGGAKEALTADGAAAAEGKPAARSYAYTEGDDGDEGQLVELKMRAPKAGRRDIVLYAMCDSWLGSDRVVPLKVKVNEFTRAEAEGRTLRGKATPLEGDASGSEAEEEDDEEDYDSEEGSTEESGSEEEEEEEEEEEGEEQEESGDESGED